MKRKLRGLKHRDIQLDFDLYRVNVPIQGLAETNLSVIDLWPEGVDRTILFVHGFAGVAETWEYQANHFVNKYRVVVPDLRGHGQSDAPFTRYTMGELVEDINAIADHLHFPDTFILAGHSFGGSLCIEYAAAFPERLEKLILISAAGEYPLPRAMALLARVPTAAFRPFWKYRPRWNAELHVMKRMALNNLMKWRAWDLLPKIKTPTLVLTGERDRYFPRRVFQGVADGIPGAEVIDIGGSKHKVQLERHQAVNRAIERFIGESERRSWRDQTSDDRFHRPWLTSYGEHTPVTFPIPKQPLHKFLERAADWFPNNNAVIFYGSTLTYRQLERRVNQFAHALHGLGIEPGDRVMVVLPNIPQMIVAYYATLKVGGVVVLPNPDADQEQIARFIDETGAKVLVTLNEFSLLAEQVKKSSDVKMVFADIANVVSRRVYKQLLARWEVAGISPSEGGEWRSLGSSMEQLIIDAARVPPEVDVEGGDLAAILYTSGTTDDPKGVSLTHSNLVANALQTRHWFPDIVAGKEVFLGVMPLTHSYGMTGVMNIPIAMAATIILLPVFELEQVLDHIKRFKPTFFPGVPSIFTAMNNASGIHAYGLSSIKLCISGAAPLPIEVQERFEKLTKARLIEGYGLTEASPVTHFNPIHRAEKSGSIGIPIPNTDAKIVDLLTNEDLPPGRIGELLVRGPQVMQGYWSTEPDEETESAIRDGWLYTGDVAVMDKDGYFTIVSRKRDTILAGDYSVFPRDVEEVLYENSKVMEAAVVGVSGGDSGEKIKAFIVPRPGTSLSKDELLDLCRKRLDEYAVPWEIEFREELPKSFIGKVLRRMLVE